jgi:hypothetical protein
MMTMEPTGPSSHQETWCLEGTLTEKDLRAFAAFLAGRVAGSRIWTLGVLVLLPLLWSGNLRAAWPLMIPVAAALMGFMLFLRFRILPGRLYKAAAALPGVFESRRITIDDQEVRNVSDSGGHTFRLEDIQEVIAAPEHLFVMVKPKQGIPIPKAWIGGEERLSRLASHLMSRRRHSP